MNGLGDVDHDGSPRSVAPRSTASAVRAWAWAISRSTSSSTGGWAVETEAPLRVPDLEDHEVNEQGHRGDGKHEKPAEPYSLGDPHDGLQRSRRTAVEQDAFTQRHVAVAQHEQRSARHQGIGQQVQQIPRQRRHMAENDVDACVGAFDERIGEAEGAGDGDDIAADLIHALQGVGEQLPRDDLEDDQERQKKQDVAAEDGAGDVELSE